MDCKYIVVRYFGESTKLVNAKQSLNRPVNTSKKDLKAYQK